MGSGILISVKRIGSDFIPFSGGSRGGSEGSLEPPLRPSFLNIFKKNIDKISKANPLYTYEPTFH